MTQTSLIRHSVLLAVLAIALGVLLFPAGSPVLGQEPTATPTISGVVFHDLDGDGVRDEGEPGLSNKAVRLLEGDVTHRRPITDPDGTYRMDRFPPGQYILEAALDGHVGICAEAGFSFNPLVRSWCFNFRLPWNATSPNPVLVTVESAATLEIDFGTQPADVAVVGGNALLEDNFAPPGTLIEALVDGQECGTTATLANSELNFQLHILGEGERAGCATTGDEVYFRVGGVPAAATFTWEPFIDAPGLGYRIRHLVAMQEHAWYWMERISDGLPAEDVVVQALVDDVVCGEALLRAPRAAGASVGFSRLIVPWEAIQPGCGRPGATVSFLVGGVEAETTVPWAPGLQQIDLVVPGAAPAPTGTPPPALPDTGFRAGSYRDSAPLAARWLWALVGVGIAALMAGLAGRRVIR